MKAITNKNKRMLQVEQENKKEIEELLRVMFVDDNIKLNDIAKQLSISPLTAARWLKLAGIYSRRLKL